MEQQADFFSRPFLEQHIQNTLAFYQRKALDEMGGFFHCFRNDGTVYDTTTRHLVSSARFVFNYAMAARYFPESNYEGWARHGLYYLEHFHRQAEGGYAWLRENGKVSDANNHCYGLAFVVLAGATAQLAGVKEGKRSRKHAFELMETYFWNEEDGLYADEASPDFSIISPYRGQNANMHACEAMIWLYEATGIKRYLKRAETLAENVTRGLAAQCDADGLIWEHYDYYWQPDWDYNRDDPQHLFRPWGFQSGHQTEWAKLLLILNRHRPKDWYIERAQSLFDLALDKAWDTEYGGIYYGFAPDGTICDSDKYFWVQAESLTAAALLAQATGEAVYRDWYERIWAYAWANMVDHDNGAWYRILTRDNQLYDDLKSPPGKTDYHTMGACYEVLRSGWLDAHSTN